MKTLNKLISILKNLVSVLEIEKLALINNDGEKILEIIETKVRITDEIQEIGPVNPMEDSRVIDLIEQINELQETNLLLTKQALKYQEVMMESIAKNLTSASRTYEQKGSYNKEQSIGLVEHTV